MCDVDAIRYTVLLAYVQCLTTCFYFGFSIWFVKMLFSFVKKHVVETPVLIFRALLFILSHASHLLVLVCALLSLLFTANKVGTGRHVQHCNCNAIYAPRPPPVGCLLDFGCCLRLLSRISLIMKSQFL